jgi:hypothetical protein
MRYLTTNHRGLLITHGIYDDKAARMYPQMDVRYAKRYAVSLKMSAH